MTGMIDITKELVSGLLPVTASDASKADCGSILIFAGSGGMPGAAVLAAYGALRSGAGLCRIATSKDNFALLQRVIPEAICVRTEYALAEIGRFDAVAIGPGMGKTLMTAGIVERVLNSFSGKLLIDADGLNVIASKEKLADDLAEFPGQAVITPHGGEAARLLGLTDPVSTDPEERVRAVTALSEVFGTVSVLKGKGTLVKGEGPAIYMNTTGNPGMATAGSGDVLTGMMTALMGRGLSAKEAAVCGVYLHGLAGDLAARELGEESLMARDIIRGIPGAFRICRG
ncbi:MAG: NAD(P)H-hydrate dehydratase [Firmicutes bacterium]|nr:NAD(P)H-hydrate dehydratase [Bacillota bacterium]